MELSLKYLDLKFIIMLSKLEKIIKNEFKKMIKKENTKIQRQIKNFKCMLDN